MASKYLLALLLVFSFSMVVSSNVFRYNENNWAYNLYNNPNAPKPAQPSQASNNANLGASSCICNSKQNFVCDVRSGITYLNECEAICVKVPKQALGNGRCGTQFVSFNGLRKNAQGYYSDCPTCYSDRELVCVNVYGYRETFQNECFARCHGYSTWNPGRCGRNI